MPTSSSGSSLETGKNKLKVFLSYSRRDDAFAKELLAALELLGFDAYLDTEDIAPGEPWEDRLGNLIRQADTVIFLISANSLASQHCGWEVEQTARSGKRLVPVVIADVANDAVPQQLRQLNYVYFTSGRSFSKGLGDLAHALRADAGWIREHTRYGEFAARWNERGKPAALLLRGSDLADAREWAKIRPSNAPEISAIQQLYLEASDKAEQDELAAKARLRWRVQIGLALVSIALAVLAGFSFLQWRSAEQSKEELARTNARLERKLALRAAPLGYLPYDVPAGWFQVATKYASAVAFVEKRTGPSRLLASGVLVRGSALKPEWGERPLFVTATYVIAKEGGATGPASQPAEAQIVMLAPNNERRVALLGDVLWQSASLGISISTIAGELPKDVEIVQSIEAKPSALAKLSSFNSADVDGLFDDNAMLKSNSELRPIVFIGNLEGRVEVAISISHLLGHLSSYGAGFEAKSLPNIAPPVGQSRAITPGPIAGGVTPDLVYTHGTLPGGGGSPIFDAGTGDLIGIHLMGYPCRGTAPAGRRCAAAGTSISRLLEELR